MANILIVEDDKTLTSAYELILKKAGHNIEVAYDGQQAMEKLEGFDPEIILLDLLMPVMDGIQFLRKYDAVNKHPKVKIIIFSNIEDPPEINEAHKLGAYKFIVKSWSSPQNLLKIIDHSLNGNDYYLTKD